MYFTESTFEMKKNFIFILYFLACIFLEIIFGNIFLITTGSAFDFCDEWDIDPVFLAILLVTSIVSLLPIGLLIWLLATKRKEKYFGVILMLIPTAWIVYDFVLN
jgi:hypothetical protein